MALVRALTTLHHNSRIYAPGDTFEYEGKLTGDVREGMEYVNAKTTKDQKKRDEQALKELTDNAKALRTTYLELQKALGDEPTQVGLMQKVLDAEIAANDAEKLVIEATGSNDDLV